ncbi:MAG TPA: glycine--tRNA ligase [Candidatus Paceibacterota bacterium]
MANTDLMEKVVSLCKRRGFIFPGSEIYGGLANSWDYGPLGVELKNNIKNLWWKKFVHERGDMVGIDAALIMNPKVWEASGHLSNFNDPLVECKNCNSRFRLDHLLEQSGKMDVDGVSFEEMAKKIKSGSDIVCLNCGKRNWGDAKQFNMMLRTYLGPTEEEGSEVYFRPETAQAMFVDFKNVVSSSRVKLPFGIAQIGKAFRNEITPGNFIFRTREFEQMEIEYFFNPKDDWPAHFDYWRDEMIDWMKEIGLDTNKIHQFDVPDGERAHYSKRTIDFEYDFPFGKDELYGLAYRTDFDLKNHFKDKPPYRDPDSGEEIYPHVIEPTFGVDRTILALLVDSYYEDGDRVVLKLNNNLAPYKAAIFPLLANKPQLVHLAREIFDSLKKDINVVWDDRGNIGKRYYSQDEIGTPYCITVDFDSLEDKSVTVRDRDTAKQERIKIKKLDSWLQDKIKI